MFDTIRLKAVGVEIKEEVFARVPNESIEETIYFDKDTGALNFRYKIGNRDFPYIMYYGKTKTIVIQLSIPKFLYGNNVKLVNEMELEEFWKKFSQKLNELLGVEISRDKWIILRVDVCWNFYVGDKVSDYIQVLAKKKLPYKNTICINHTETVTYKNDSNEIMFYDKAKQCKHLKESEDIIETAKGIIRMEIRPSRRDIKRFSLDRSAMSILRKDFFNLMTADVLNKITLDVFSINEFEITHEWLLNQKLNRVETVIGFMIVLNAIGETKAKELYGSTYYARKKLAEDVTFPKGKHLPSLDIQYVNVS